MGFFNRLTQGLSKTRDSINQKIEGIFKFTKKIDEETLEELEELLITADVGVSTTQILIDKLRAQSKHIKSPEELKAVLKEELISLF